MRPVARILVAIAAALACLAGPAAAELSEAQLEKSRGFLRDMADGFIDRREQAMWGIAALGRDAAPFIERAVAEEADPEVKLRCTMALYIIREQAGRAAAAVAAVEVQNLDASRVTIHAKDAPLKQVLWEITAQSGNRPVLTPADGFERTVTFDATDMPYWEALDGIARAAGYYVVDREHQNGAALKRGEAGPQLACYAGPVVVKVTGSGSQRYFSGAREFRWASYGFEWRLEERVPAIAGRLKITRALTADGRDVTPKSGSAGGVVSNQMGTIDRGQFQQEFPDVPDDASRPVLIDGVVSLTCCVGLRELRIEDVVPGEGREATAHGVTLRVTAVRPNARGVSLDLLLEHDAAHEVRKEFEYNVLCAYGFFLVNPDGAQPFTGIQNVRRKGNQTTLTMGATWDDRFKGPWSLVYRWPEKVVTRDYPFSFKNLPPP